MTIYLPTDTISNTENVLSNIKDNKSFSGSILSFIQDWKSNQMYFTMHTSGSTGKPKLISVSRNQILASISQTQKAFNLSKGDSCLVNLSCEHIAGKMMLARAMEIGMDIYLTNVNGNPLESLTQSIDFFSFVPLQLQNILERTPDKVKFLDQAKAILIGGASINTNLLKQIENIKAPVFASYGMTETVSHIALQRLNGNQADEHFKTLPNIKLSTDESHCLKINAAVTSYKTIITNDVVELKNNGFILLGRKDNIINSGGIKIQAEVIEKAISKLFQKTSLKNQFFIASKKDEKLGEKVILVVESKNELNLDLSSLIESINKYGIPKDVFYTQRFKLTSSGKIDKIATLKNL